MCFREPPNIAAAINYPQMLSAMKRAKRKNTPPIPDNYEEYEQMLQGRYEDFDGTKFYYKRVGEANTESIVFIVEPLENLIKETKEIHLDGTFKVVPNAPASRQLFTILFMKSDHVSFNCYMHRGQLILINSK